MTRIGYGRGAVSAPRVCPLHQAVAGVRVGTEPGVVLAERQVLAPAALASAGVLREHVVITHWRIRPR